VHQKNIWIYLEREIFPLMQTKFGTMEIAIPNESNFGIIRVIYPMTSKYKLDAKRTLLFSYSIL